MNRMHVMYPDVVTAELLRSSSASINGGSLGELRTVLEVRRNAIVREMTDITSRTSAASRGSRGSSYSFGGGSSSGGGGGRW